MGARGFTTWTRKKNEYESNFLLLNLNLKFAIFTNLKLNNYEKNHDIGLNIKYQILLKNLQQDPVILTNMFLEP